MKAAADAAELNATIKQLQDSASVLQWFRAFLEQPINRELQQQHVEGLMGSLEAGVALPNCNQLT